jgi:hypothetical protein
LPVHQLGDESLVGVGKGDADVALDDSAGAAEGPQAAHDPGADVRRRIQWQGADQDGEEIIEQRLQPPGQILQP